MANFRRVQPGDPLTADAFNAIAEQLERFANLSVADGGPLRLWSGPTGKALALAIPRDTLARLSGSSSPYSWTEVSDASGGTYTEQSNANSGTSNAYEVNGVSGLDGQLAWLTWSAARDWRFQWVGHGASPPCEGGRICVTVDSDGCSPSMPVFGAAVTVTDTAEPPNVIGTAITIAQVVAISLTDPGSGYTNGTGYPLQITGDGTGATGTFDVIDGQVTNLLLTDGGSGYTSAAIAFPGAGPGTGATATATIKGRCCIEIPSAGTYNINVHIPGAADQTATIDAACNFEENVALSYPANALGTLCFRASRCETSIQGMPITLLKDDTSIASGQTDANGLFCLRLGAGTRYSYTATVGSATLAGSLAIDPCTTKSAQLSTITNYYMKVYADSDNRNDGCFGTFTLYSGTDDTGTILGSQSITLSLDFETGTYMSPLHVLTFSDIPYASDVYYELIFPNSSSSGTFTLDCTLPSLFHAYFITDHACN